MDINIDTSLKEYGFYGVEHNNTITVVYGVAINDEYEFTAFESFEYPKANCRQYIAEIGKKRLKDVYRCCGITPKDSLLSKLEAIHNYYGNDFMFSLNYTTLNLDEAKALFG